MQRAEIIQTWLSRVLHSDDFQMQYLVGDASFRRYARIRQGQNSYMLMDAPPEKEDCRPFVQISAYLDQHGTRVPHIVAQDIEQGLLLLEDFGDRLLSTVLNADTVDHYYLQAMRQIVQLQSIAQDSHIFPLYSAAKLEQEMRLFDEWLLPALNIDLDERQQAMLARSYQWIVEQIQQQPQVIVHRDYHSRNLMVLDHEEQLGVIDFQDAVIGADSYDLISLIRDAYVQWPKDKVNQWVAQFYQLLPTEARAERSLEQFRQDVEVMSVQRHLKVLGIFVRLCVRDGKSGYLKDLPRVMWYLRQELQQCPPLFELQQFIEQTVMAAFTAKYGVYQEVGV